MACLCSAAGGALQALYYAGNHEDRTLLALPVLLLVFFVAWVFDRRFSGDS